MLCYKILNVTFAIDNGELWVDKQKQEAKEATIQALQIFLQSDGELVSKEDLLEKIWKDVYVSEASAFKQVQLVKQIFASASLSKDCLENVYGKGYKIKYPIKVIDNDDENLDAESSDQSKESKPSIFAHLHAVLLLTLLVLISYLTYYLSNDKIVADMISKERREEIGELMSDDWQKGLSYIDTLLDKEPLSKNDKAFLFEQKAICQYYLVQFDNSLKSYQKALKLYEKIENRSGLGQVHLGIARVFSRKKGTTDNLKNQLNHLDKAIELFELDNDAISLIDSTIVRGHYYRDNEQVEKALVEYQKAIVAAQKTEDDVGVMIAINNTASAYALLNDFDKAVELGEKGLALTLELNKNRYIANSYSFLSNLYQQQGQTHKALEMIEQAIKYQINANDFVALMPKAVNLSFILVETFQYKKAEELLALLEKFATKLSGAETNHVVLLYKGMNQARQNNWSVAESHFAAALYVSKMNEVDYKQPLIMAYLALAHYFNNNYIQSIEPARKVFDKMQNTDKSRAIAALALAYTYVLMESDLATQWLSNAQELITPQMLFEYHLFLKLKQESIIDTRSVIFSELDAKISQVSKTMENLVDSPLVDEQVYSNLVKQIKTQL